MPQNQHETAYILEFNGDDSNPLFDPVTRTALAGKTAAEYAATLDPEEVISDPKVLREIQQRLAIPETPAAACTLSRRPFLVFYEV